MGCKVKCHACVEPEGKRQAERRESDEVWLLLAISAVVWYISFAVGHAPFTAVLGVLSTVCALLAAPWGRR